MKIRGADFVLYFVSDFPRAVDFYRDALHLPSDLCSFEWQWAEFDCGNLTLAIKGGAAPTSIMPGPRLALAVDDLPAAHAELIARKVRLGGPPEDHGVCQALEVFDPDGNMIILHHRTDGTCG